MKTTILKTAVAFVVVATGLGVTTALLGRDSEMLLRLTTVAGVFGLGSIGLFFVGLAYPNAERPVVSSVAIRTGNEK